MTKQEILRVFEQYKGEIISGNELGEKLGITRTAVWKVIKHLREEGYDIESIKKKGYRLNINSDILSHIKINERLKHHHYDLRLFKTVESTNKVAKLAAITEDKEWIVIASEKQEVGRGRLQTDFISPDGKGIYMSFVIQPNVPNTSYKALLGITREAIKVGIERVAHVRPEITKDYHIVYNDKKIGGILSEACVELESQQINSVIIGIGIYVYHDKSYSEKTIRNIGCLAEITGSYCNRSELIAEILNAFYERYQIFMAQKTKS